MVKNKLNLPKISMENVLVLNLDSTLVFTQILTQNTLTEKSMILKYLTLLSLINN